MPILWDGQGAKACDEGVRLPPPNALSRHGWNLGFRVQGLGFRERHLHVSTLSSPATAKSPHIVFLLSTAQVLQRVSLVLGAVALVGCLCIMAALLGRGDSAGYSVVIAVVVLVSTIPVGMPVVTATVLAVGARDMARHKAIVNR